jgi:predicted RNA binding protein YcfA (HicA-like mRNA interferase family)
MKPVNGKEMCHALERAGWVLRRIQGSHYIYHRRGARRPIPVPVHGSQTLRAATQKSIMRGAGLTDADL